MYNGTLGLYFTMLLNNCNIIGLTNSRYHILFTSGGFNLIRGSHITKRDKEDKIAIISKQLADKNNLRIGDTITVSPDVFSYSSLTIPLKIVGIYEYVGDITQTVWSQDYEIENYIFMPSEMLQKNFFSYRPTQLILYVQDLSHIEEYKQEIEKKLDDKYKGSITRVMKQYKYTWDEEWFEIVSRPVQDVNNMAMSMVMIIAVGTYFIILLISILILIGKKREISIYLSTGESKAKLILQMVME